MPQKIRTYCLLLLLAGIYHQTIAQLPDVHFEQLSVEDGLAANSATSFIQDKQGYMWFATRNGLSRYDGITFTTFLHDPTDPTTLAGNYVEKVYEDKAGNLWVGTFCCGLDRFDRETEQFIHYRHDPSDSFSLSHDIVTTILEDSQGILWVGTTGGGLNQFNRKKKNFKHYRHDAADKLSLSNDNVRAIYEEKQGTLWIGTGGPARTTEGGLNRFNLKTETFTRYLHEPGNTSTLIDNRVWGLCEDNEGNFWVGSWSDGLHLMDRETGIFTRLTHNPNKPNELSAPYLRKIDDSVPALGRGVTFIHQDRSEVFWLGAYLGGLDRFDPKTGAKEHYEADKNNPNAVSTNYFWNIYEDQQNTLWLGVLFSGIYKILPGVFNLYQYEIKALNVQTIFEDVQQQVWFGTNEGLYQLDKEKNEIKPIPYSGANFSDLKETAIQTIVGDGNKGIWVGTTDGLYQFDFSSLQLNAFKHKIQQSNSLSNNHILALCPSVIDSTSLWIGTKDDVLNHYNKTTKQFTPYPLGIDSMTTTMFNEQADNSINTITEDSKGNLWIGTQVGGILKWNPTTQISTYYLTDVAFISAIHEDQKGRFWISSINHGLMQFNPIDGTITNHYMEKDGLKSSSITGILEDESGLLWLGLSNGLSRFDPEKQVFRNFDQKDGFQLNRFLLGSATKSVTGDFFFGGIDGVTAFNPKAFTANPYPPEVVISKLWVNGNPLVVGSKTAINLSYAEKDLIFEYAALHFTRPEANQVMVKLEGYDEVWQSVNQVRTAKYTNLNPATYTFKVKAANSDGVWNEKEATLKIVITPPWWQTWWAKILYVVTGMGILFFFRQFELRKQQKKLAEQQRINAVTSKFVPTAFLQSLGRKDIMEVQLGDAIEQEVTVLFSDIRDYTTLSEKMTPEENFSFVNAFNKRMGPVIQQNQGFVNQYLGDAIMALFQASPKDALQAAIQMQQTLQQYNQEREVKKLQAIRMGIGFHTGSLIMGIIGDEKRMDAATISDAVNIAARIESLTKHYGVSILLSEDSYQQIPEKEHFHFRYLGKVIVKGRQQPVGIYECFDGDKPAQIDLKKQTLDVFQTGLDQYFKQSFSKAKQSFEETLLINPTDGPAQFFQEKADYYIEHAVPIDWTGIEKMEQK